MKIASGIITLIILAASGVAWFFLLLLGLNGFSERDANPAMIFFIVWMIFFAVLLAAGSFFLTKILIAKSLNAVLALILSVVAAVGVGFLLDFGGMVISAIIADQVKESYKKK